MEEGRLIGADVDERRLDSRQHRLDLPVVDVADHPPGFRTVDEQLNELVVLQDCDAGFPLRRVDE